MFAYVPVVCEDVKVEVNIYTLLQTVKEADEFFQRRMDHVAKQLGTIQPALMDKQKLLEGMNMSTTCRTL